MPSDRDCALDPTLADFSIERTPKKRVMCESASSPRCCRRHSFYAVEAEETSATATATLPIVGGRTAAMDAPRASISLSLTSSPAVVARSHRERRMETKSPAEATAAAGADFLSNDFVSVTSPSSRRRRECRLRRPKSTLKTMKATTKSSINAKTRRRYFFSASAVFSCAGILALTLADFENYLSGGRWGGGMRWGQPFSPVVAAVASSEDDASSSYLPRDFLTKDSVVLITGAAGFIGSELAVALRSTYDVKKLLCVDSMASGLGNGGPSASSSRTETEYRGKVQADGLLGGARTEEELALFEFKRQRAFRILQTAGPRVHFYRSDFRPTIPEYFDVGEVPLLDTIFRTHPDITHVVHLADPYHGAAFGLGSTQAVPRTKEDTKSGMIEAIFEQLKKVADEKGADAVPHLTYASSSEVYYHLSDYDGNPNPPPFKEENNITIPSTLRGASKLIDEVLASAYNDYHGLYSVGLRLFNVYGPWGLPGTPLFEMAERAVSDRETPILPKRGEAEMGMIEDDVRDYVHLDDAVDAVLAAMQFRPVEWEGHGEERAAAPNVVINVGTGRGATLREAADIMEQHFPRETGTGEANENNDEDLDDETSEGKGEGGRRRRGPPTVSYASTDRAEALLGFKSRVSLEDGLADLLAWHYDRAFPYGGRPSSINADRDDDDIGGGETTTPDRGERYIASRGIESCSPLDRECLRGAPVFPCASECSNPSLCIRTCFEDAVYMSRSITDGCGAVLYTVALGEEVSEILSANVAVAPESIPSVREAGLARCNVAFVSEGSPLVRRMKVERRINPRLPIAEEFYRRSVDGKDASDLFLRHGHWTLIPVANPPGLVDAAIRLLPKLSPGSFFSPRVKHAIYADPDVTFHSVPGLLKEARMQPLKEGMQGVTAMLIGDGLADGERRRKKGATATAKDWGGSDGGGGGLVPGGSTPAEAHQLRAYNMIRVGLRGEMRGGGALPIPDSSWVVHALGVEDARLFRCDAYGEVLQWEASSDERAVEFVMGLHDLWSRVIVRWGGMEPWWTGEGSGPVRVGPEEDEREEEASTARRRLTGVIGFSGQKEEDVSSDSGTTGDPIDLGEGSLWDEVAESSHGRRLAEVADKMGKNDKGDLRRDENQVGSWMGVLSSTETQNFVRIMPSSAIGAVHLGDYDF